MEMEPETLPLWHKMIEAIKSHIKYSSSVKKTIVDIKVTDIFCDLDEKAVHFWGQLLAERSMKSMMETLLGCTLKKGGGKVRVQQIPLSRDTEISQDFIDFVARKIRTTERLWTCSSVDGLNRACTIIEQPSTTTTYIATPIAEIPITPGPTETITRTTEPEHTRNYSQRQMQGSVLDKSLTTLRRVHKKASEVLQEAFNCDKSQVTEIAKIVCTPNIGALKALKDTQKMGNKFTKSGT
jgi:hypothetical protein